jgi:RNA polymerase sigma factor (sigma-70 family)
LNYTDSEILAAIRDGNDKNAIKSLYDSVLPNVEYFVCSNSGSHEDAFDVFQDALIVFYKQVASGNFDVAKYKIHGFVYTISKNLWINVAKKKGRAIKWEREQNKHEHESSFLEKVVDDERTMTLEKLFNSMDPKCVQLLTMSIYNKLSMREIAEKLGAVSEDTVKVQCHRCRKKLSELVKQNSSLLNILRN